MNYEEWNNAIAAHFFNESRAGEKVFLHVDTDLINTLAGNTNGAVDFVSAVLEGPTDLAYSRKNYCWKGVRLRRIWRTAGAHGLPPYIAYLAAFVLGASMEGVYQNEGYYKRLHRLLGEEVTNVPPPHFYEAKDLWDDLKQWANEDNHGNLGIVRCEFAGYTPYVNLPRAQIVLSGQERARLPALFATVEADPHAPPSPKEMLRMCLEHGAGRLEAKTLRRLRGQGDPELAALTIEAVLEELRYWDSTIGDLDDNSRELHYLRINLQILDRLSGRASSTFVVKDTEGWPETGMALEAAPGRTVLLIGFDGNWSRPLSDEQGAAIDAASYRWESGFSLNQGRTTVRFPARSLRVFRKGEFEVLNGLIEVNRLDPYQEFYIAASAFAQPRVDAWGKAAAAAWSRIPIRSGLPSGWVLFKGDTANPNYSAPPEFPMLNCDTSLRIILQGGLKIKPAGRRYFNWSPPSIRFEGLTPTMAVAVNGTALLVGPGDTVHSFAHPVPAGIMKIDVLENGEEKCSASFEAVDDASLPWREVNGEPFTLPSGGLLEQDTGQSCVCGAKLLHFVPPPVVLGLTTVCDLVGRRSSEVQSGLKEGPPEWPPIWLVEKGRGRRKVVFCGGDPAACAPVVDAIIDKRTAREWKEILWYDRKHLAGPTRGAIARLWKEYREAAKNV